VYQEYHCNRRIRNCKYDQENHALVILFSNKDTTSKDDQKPQLSGKSFRKDSQIRRKPSSRRPKYYWTKLENIERELEEFWMIDCGVPLPQKKNNKQGSGPCIPNETLLNYFGRNDLRAAIVNTQGGREILSEKLRGAPIMPGKWSEAVATSPELQAMLQNGTFAFSKESPPLSPQQKKCKSPRENSISNLSNKSAVNTRNAKGNDNSQPQKWMHKSGRKPKGYWTLPRIVAELYEYLDQYRERYGRPSIWMPRPSELVAEGREDLKLAMTRFGGAKRIGSLAGLVSFREWNYFEGQYELLLLLKQYLDEFGGPTSTDDTDTKYKYFPTLSAIRSDGYHRLNVLVQYYGGRALVAGRFGMELERRSIVRQKFVDVAKIDDISYGEFSIEFAIRLMEFIRAAQYKLNPPVTKRAMYIPKESRLKTAGPEGEWLHEKIIQYGGYENVARRLNLLF
jgi:hypothetical protein